jgi:hypothetical protein
MFKRKQVCTLIFQNKVHYRNVMLLHNSIWKRSDWRWLKQFQEIASVLRWKGVGRPSTSQADVNRIHEVFSRSPHLLCQSRVIVKMIVEKQMECRLAGETKVLGENLPQHHFCPSQNATWPDPSLKPGRHGGKLATNRLSYGAAILCS